ncbi:MAG: ribose-phosphate diphosphokinase [Spirochaetales bacterium]|nr:ribose-phosphate diphosphokinase [Spirochaetales bacterium]
MLFTRSSYLGVISCPGAEGFSEEIITSLKTIYQRRFDKVAGGLAKKYNLPLSEVIQKINFTNDLNAAHIKSSRDSIDKSTPPQYGIPIQVTRFSNGEFKSEILRSIRGMDVYIISDVENHYPLRFGQDEKEYHLSVNDHVMILFSTLDTVLSSGARSATLVLPVYPYSRQHKRKGREGLTASWFGKVCEFMGASMIITLDIHSKAIENACHRLTIENLHASFQIIKELTKLIDIPKEDLVVVAPDTGAVDRNRFYAEHLNKPLAMLYKERDYSRISSNADCTNITSVRLLGEVKGKTVFMADDILGTGGTLIKAMRILKDMGAKKIICAVSLPLFSAHSVEYFNKAYEEGLFEYLIGTNAVYHDASVLSQPWYKCAGISSLFATMISRIHHGKSVSRFLDNREIIYRLLHKKDS